MNNRPKILLLTILAMVAGGCLSHETVPKKNNTLSHKKAKVSIDQLIIAEQNASKTGQRILSTGRHMALDSKEIVRGACWDYINVVFNRAGFPMNKRQQIHKGKKATGPYATPAQIQAGDWLYYVNHSYHDVPHSGIFIRWVDKSKRIGEILSYGGERRNKPGRYRNYDLSHVYTIIRARPE